MSEGLLDDDSAPCVLGLLAEPRAPELLDNLAEEAVSRGEIEQDVASRSRFAILNCHHISQISVGPEIGKVAPEIAHAACQPVPSLLIELSRLELAAAGLHQASHFVG